MLSCMWFGSFLPMSAVLGPGLRPRKGAEPTDPSDRTGSEKESVLNTDSKGGMVGSGNSNYKTD